MKRLCSVITLLAIVLGGTLTAEEGKKQEEKAKTTGDKAESGYELIYEVNEVTLSGNKVTATGTASTAGWTEPRLVPFKEGPDGVYRLRFEAKRPTGIVAEALSAIGPAEYDFKKLPANFMSVIVEAAQNKKEAARSETSEAKEPSRDGEKKTPSSKRTE